MTTIPKLWQKRVPIRLRLTAWYVVAFGLILFIFAGILENQMLENLENEADRTLLLGSNRALAYLRVENGQPAIQEGGALADMDDDYSITLLTPDQQTVLQHIGIPNAPLFAVENQPGTVENPHKEKWEHNDSWRVYTQPVRNSDGTLIGWLQISRVFDEDHLLGMVRGHFCLGVPIGLLLSALGGLFLASRALKPIDSVTRTAQAITASDLNQRLNYDGPTDEVGRLAKTFDQMLDRLQAGFDRERRFSGDAAHELRTPLTALKGQIGVTLSQPRVPTDYVDVLRSLEGQVDRLIRLSSDLLFMARLDANQSQRQIEQINLGEWLAAVEDQMRPLAEAKGITLQSRIAPDLLISGSMDLLIRLFLNLLDNAIKYTPDGGAITIEACQSAAGVQIAISDSGPGIPAEHLPHLFERFYRVEADRARGQANSGAGVNDPSLGGTGLGLAIAQEIARVHGGQIMVSSGVGQGTTFTVHLPK